MNTSSVRGRLRGGQGGSAQRAGAASLVPLMGEYIETSRLASGVTVVTETMPDVRSVTTGVWVGVGSRDEVPREAGASHFLEHLLFKGTDDRRAHEIAEMIDAVGGEMNAYTTKEYTAFHTRTLAEDLDVGLGLLCDILSSPALREEEVDTERQVILEEILLRGDEPADLVHDVIHELAYEGHGLGRDPLGDAQTVEGQRSVDIRSFMDATYVGSSMVVAAAGRVRHDDVVKRVEARLVRPQGPGAPKRCAPDAVSGGVRVQPEDTEQAHVVVAFPALDRHDPDRYALSIADHVLGGGLSSRLFMEIREKRGLAYSVYSYRAAYVDAGLWCIYAGTAPGRAEEVLGLIDAALLDLRTNGVSEAELTRAKSSVRAGTALGLEDSGSRMSRIGRSLLLHGEVLPIDVVLSRTEAISSADCHRAIERVLSQPRLLAVVGPFEESAFAGYGA